MLLATHPLSEDRAKAIRATQSRVTLPGGMVLGLTEWQGPRRSAEQRPPIVFVHGLGDSSSAWLGIAPYLCDRYRVLGIDLRGHGESDWSADRDYRTNTHAADVDALLDLLGLDVVSLVGHSLGGAVALRYAVRHPQRTHSLVIVDHGPDVADASAEHIRNAIRDACRVYRHPDDFAAVLRARHALGDAELLKHVAATMVREARDGGYMLKHDPAVVRDVGQPAPSGRRIEENNETWQLLGTLRTRTAIMRGIASSVLSAAVAKRMVESIGGEASLETIPMAGHSIHLDNAAGLRESILRFFA